MKGAMGKLGKWFRPPRHLLMLFILVAGVPAATLIALGLRLLEQERELAGQRRFELLDRAADQGVRLLQQDLQTRVRLLSTSQCSASDAPDDSVCVVLHADSIEPTPPGRIRYYPFAQSLTEIPTESFQDADSAEFREPVHLDKALEMNRKLAASKDAAVRAGALLRAARILRKLAQPDKALAAYADLGRISSVSINHEPADLVARRARCAILAEQSRAADLRREAAEIATDLHAGKWQLDREGFLHVDGTLHTWLNTPAEMDADSRDALSEAVAWICETGG